MPETYLVWAILTTLFCCLPGGIVSIVYAAQVSGKYNSGDYAGAVASSENAKKWAIYSAIAGVAVVVLYFVFAAALLANN
jgi:Interferon-induced transmembrane protein